MSHELHIHKIGPINDCRLALGNFTILTGPQANGKSTAAKLLAGQTVKFIFLETGMISVMPVPLLAAIHGNVAHKVVLDMYLLLTHSG